MSLMTSFISAVTILGTTSENYLYGTQYLLLNFSYVIGTPIVNFVFLPVFFNSGDKISVYQVKLYIRTYIIPICACSNC